MSIYHNSYFKLQLTFSEGWKHRSWRLWKKPPVCTEFLQCSDDDVPADEKGYKTLFNAIHRIKMSPSIISCQLSMEVHRRNNGFDLESRIPKRSDEIAREFTTGKIFGTESKSLNFIQKADTYSLSTQVVVWEAFPKLWLSACMSGDTPDNFEEAKRQFQKIMCIQ